MLPSIRILFAIFYSYIASIYSMQKYKFGNKKYGKRESRERIYQALQKIARRMAKAAGMEVKVLGAENLPKEGPVVYMANHKGLFDAVALVSTIDDPMIAIVKKEVKKMPIISRWIGALGCIYLDRKDMKQSLAAILEGIKELKEGQSVLIFPEGTRSKTDELGKFKEGSFKLALKANVPIVPIAILNTEKVFEAQKRIVPHTVYMKVGNPIDTPNLTAEEKKLLPKTVENTVKALLDDLKNNN